MKRNFFVAAVVFSSHLLNPGLVTAQDSSSLSLDEIVVTANKYPRKQSETGKVLTVINAEQLEKNNGSSLPEILNRFAGINMIGANNNLGSNITPSIRGASAGNTLILLDGIPVNDPSVVSNNFDLNFIPVAQIERIEILKGGQSTLYGSDAVAGVINIISKKAKAGKLNGSGTFAAGSYQTTRESVFLGGTGKKVAYHIQYSHTGSDGFSAATDTVKGSNSDRDGYEQYTVRTGVDITITTKLKTKVYGLYSTYNADLDAAAFTDDRDFTVKNRNRQAGGELLYSFTNGSVHANYQFNHAKRNYLDNNIDIPNPFSSYSTAEYIGRTHFAELYMNYKKGSVEVLGGIDYRHHSTDQDYYSTGSFGPYQSKLTAEMNQLSPYASIVYRKDKMTLEAGSRVNFHSSYGANSTFNFNPSFKTNNKQKIFANLYTSFKAPTLYQLFDNFAGNEELEPEKGLTGEIGVDGIMSSVFSYRLVGFYRHSINTIVYTSDPVNYTSTYFNAAEQTNYGVEAETNYKKGRWNLLLNYTYTNGKTVSGFDGTGSPLSKDTSYFNLYRIPKHAVNFTAGIQLTKKLFASTSAHVLSKRQEFVYAGTPAELDGYTLIDLFGEYRFDPRIKLYIALKNLTNKKYIDIVGFNTRKFNFETGVQFSF